VGCGRTAAALTPHTGNPLGVGTWRHSADKLAGTGSDLWHSTAVPALRLRAGAALLWRDILCSEEQAGAEGNNRVSNATTTARVPLLP